ncbi:lipocalin-like domain-containing protein [Streptomyces sp. NPDC003247]|uniref:lipocalin-like domain-containing protein n=1 Tax=Streptomyces sp. NPDC003247 TaxID=3364677 RepID=UPI003681CBD5
MHPAHPTLISAADTLAQGPSRSTDSWWFTARLQTEGTAFWAKIHAITVRDTVHSTVAVLQDPGGHTSHTKSIDSRQAVTLSTDRLDIRTPLLTMHGNLEHLELTGATDTASLRLTLHRETPVLYSGGSGIFPFLDGTTGQYALPGLTTTGTLTADGTTYTVSGRTWFDRQWVSPGTQPPRFTWLGLDLGADRYLSVWDTTGDGTSWLTELTADGTHTITAARRTDSNGVWTLTAPSLDATLDITHRQLSADDGRFYGGVCTVTGTHAGDSITGHGYTDIVG